MIQLLAELDHTNLLLVFLPLYIEETYVTQTFHRQMYSALVLNE